jgi:phage tail P2-like protein
MSDPIPQLDTSAPISHATHPITSLLPGENGAYTDNPAARSLTAPFDNFTAAIISALTNFYARALDPLTCEPAYLDWLAQWAGYTGVYWDSAWPVTAKRALIAEAYTRVWPEKGSQALLVWLLNLFEIDSQIVSSSEPLRADVSRVGDRVGGASSIFHILLPMHYSRLGQWLIVRRLVALYTPIWIPYTISYVESRADIMRAGEVVTQ